MNLGQLYSDSGSEWRISVPNDVAAIGGLSDLRMNPQLGTSKARNDFMPTGNADWAAATAKETPPITTAPALSLGGDQPILPPDVMHPLAHHGAGACDVCLPCAVQQPPNTNRGCTFLSTLSGQRLPQICGSPPQVYLPRDDFINHAIK